MRSILSLVLVLALAAPALAATPFADVPKAHWSYAAISQAVDAGILQGYDGKFHGERLLNRFQMAVIVAKLLDAVKPGAPGAAKADKKTLGNVDALSTEFADELALLNTKVAALEGTTTELKKDLDAMKGAGATGTGLGFTAFAQVGLVSTDLGSSSPVFVPAVIPAPWPIMIGNLTRYTNESPDSMFFTLPQVAIGVDKEVNPGVFFHAQFDYASDVNDAEAGNVGINEAYFFVDEMFGPVGGKVGAFALPFSMEHNGPFRTCNFTITPSGVNTLNEAWRGYGFELQRTKDVKPEDLIWKVGVVSGTDAPTSRFPGWTDAPVHVNTGFRGEGDDNFGYYLYVGKKPEGKGYGWNAAFFSNGGDAPMPPSGPDDTDEISYWQVGFEWWGDQVGVLAQYVDGRWSPPFMPAAYDFTLWYLLLNLEINEKNNVTLRYDRANLDLNPIMPADYDVQGWTVAINHKVTENSLFQFEYLTATSDFSIMPTGFDPQDDLVQLRYKVHF